MPTSSHSNQDSQAVRTVTNADLNASRLQPPANLRAMTNEELSKHVSDTQKDLDAVRKEVEKLEKAWTKKTKDIGRWKEVILR